MATLYMAIIKYYLDPMISAVLKIIYCCYEHASSSYATHAYIVSIYAVEYNFCFLYDTVTLENEFHRTCHTLSILF